MYTCGDINNNDNNKSKNTTTTTSNVIFANQRIHIVLQSSVCHIDGWCCPKFMHKSKNTSILVWTTSSLKKEKRKKKNTNGRTYVSNLKINKHALPIIITKCKKIPFSIRCLHMFHRRLTSVTRFFHVCIQSVEIGEHEK
jgi:hypothetical protein